MYNHRQHYLHYTGKISAVIQNVLCRDRSFLWDRMLCWHKNNLYSQQQKQTFAYLKTKSAESISFPHLVFLMMPPFPTTAHFLYCDLEYGMSWMKQTYFVKFRQHCGLSKSKRSYHQVQQHPTNVRITTSSHKQVMNSHLGTY